MTAHEILSEVISSLDPSIKSLHLVRRNGHVLLGLPRQREAAARTLRLYQPQRLPARILVAVLRGLVKSGLHHLVLPKTSITTGAAAVRPVIEGIQPGSCGVLLGSHEHRIRRAILCYRNSGSWEVAKISFGGEGFQLLEREARALKELQPLAPGIPDLLGFHRTERMTVLRMPYLTGKSISPGENREALDLLRAWISHEQPKPITDFSEWTAIEAALSGLESKGNPLKLLSIERLRPVVCHGDFARWNLLRKKDGGLVVLDWEWGHQDGLPGIDLVHYFLQDARLVKRLSPIHAIQATREALRMPACRDYLEATGWSGDPILPIIACLAYKQGAGHQENRDILTVSVSLMEMPRQTSSN